MFLAVVRGIVTVREETWLSLVSIPNPIVKSHQVFWIARKTQKTAGASSADGD
jgi:hypothetical protein